MPAGPVDRGRGPLHLPHCFTPPRSVHLVGVGATVRGDRRGNLGQGDRRRDRVGRLREDGQRELDQGGLRRRLGEDGRRRHGHAGRSRGRAGCDGARPIDRRNALPRLGARQIAADEVGEAEGPRSAARAHLHVDCGLVLLARSGDGSGRCTDGVEPRHRGRGQRGHRHRDRRDDAGDDGQLGQRGARGWTAHHRLPLRPSLVHP